MLQEEGEGEPVHKMQPLRRQCGEYSTYFHQCAVMVLSKWQHINNIYIVKDQELDNKRAKLPDVWRINNRLNVDLNS